MLFYILKAFKYKIQQESSLAHIALSHAFQVFNAIDFFKIVLSKSHIELNHTFITNEVGVAFYSKTLKMYIAPP